MEHLELPNRRHLPRISSYQGILHSMTVTVFVRGDPIHMVYVIGIKLAFSVTFLIRKLTLLQMAEESLIRHDVMREEGALYCLHLFVRHSILNDISMENAAFIRTIPFKSLCFQERSNEKQSLFLCLLNQMCIFVKKLSLFSQFGISLTCKFLPYL